MRADQLGAVLRDVEGVLTSAGAGSAGADIAALAEYLEHQGARDADEVIAEIKEKLDPATAIRLAVAGHVERLKAAGFDETAFKSAFASLKADATLRKPDDLLQVLKGYGVIRISGRTQKSYLDSLEKHFYWLLYNRDADAMAGRATPW